MSDVRVALDRRSDDALIAAARRRQPRRRLDVAIDRYEVDAALLRSGAARASTKRCAPTSSAPCARSRDSPTTRRSRSRYRGPRIDRAALLRYLVSYRRHAGFHEHCVERMFVDLDRALPLRSADGQRALHAPRRPRHQSVPHQRRRTPMPAQRAHGRGNERQRRAMPCAALLTFTGDPFVDGVAATRRYERDAIVAMHDGRIAACGPATEVLQTPARGHAGHAVRERADRPGFIDCARPLSAAARSSAPAASRCSTGWPATRSSRRSASPTRTMRAPSRAPTCARTCATASPRRRSSARCTRMSVDVLFEEAAALDMRMIAGKVLMDRNAPAALLDTAQRGYDEIKALIARWHGNGRLGYAITPRFAVTSTPAQLDAAGALKREHPGRPRAVARVGERWPRSRSSRRCFPRRRRISTSMRGTVSPARARSTAMACTSTKPISRSCTRRDTAHRALPDVEQFPRQRPLQARRREARATGPCAWGSPPTSAAARASRSCARCRRRTRWRSCRARRCRRRARSTSRRAARRARSTSTTASAASRRAWRPTSSCWISRPRRSSSMRMRYANDIDEVLAVQMALGDDRAVRATYVAGRRAYDRDARSSHEVGGVAAVRYGRMASSARHTPRSPCPRSPSPCQGAHPRRDAAAASRRRASSPAEDPGDVAQADHRHQPRRRALHHRARVGRADVRAIRRRRRSASPARTCCSSTAAKASTSRWTSASARCRMVVATRRCVRLGGHGAARRAHPRRHQVREDGARALRARRACTST